MTKLQGVWRGVAAWACLALIALAGPAVAASDGSCAGHGEAVRDCDRCVRAHAPLGVVAAGVLNWTHKCDNWGLVRRDGATLEYRAGQPQLQVKALVAFGGSFVSTVLWDRLDAHTEAAVLPSRQAVTLMQYNGMLTAGPVQSIAPDEPALVLRVSVLSANYDTPTRQAGPFRSAAQCTVFYKDP